MAVAMRGGKRSSTDEQKRQNDQSKHQREPLDFCRDDSCRIRHPSQGWRRSSTKGEKSLEDRWRGDSGRPGEPEPRRRGPRKGEGKAFGWILFSGRKEAIHPDPCQEGHGKHPEHHDLGGSPEPVKSGKKINDFVNGGVDGRKRGSETRWPGSPPKTITLFSTLPLKRHKAQEHQRQDARVEVLLGNDSRECCSPTRSRPHSFRRSGADRTVMIP